MKYLGALFVILATSISAFGQSPWLSLNESNLIQIEWQKPNFNLNPNSNQKVSTLSSIVFLNGKFKLNGKFNLIAEIPISHWELSDPNGLNQQDAHTTIGNIYVGTELLFNDDYSQLDFAGQFGIRIPTLPEPFFPNELGYFTGFIASPDRREAFRLDFIPIYMNATVLIEPNPNIDLSIRAGGIYSIYKGDINALDNEVHFLYSTKITYSSSFLDSSIGISGRKDIITQDFFIGTGETSTELWAMLEKRFEQWTPSLYLRTHLDEQNQAVTYVIGAQAKIGF